MSMRAADRELNRHSTNDLSELSPLERYELEVDAMCRMARAESSLDVPGILSDMILEVAAPSKGLIPKEHAEYLKDSLSQILERMSSCSLNEKSKVEDCIRVLDRLSAQ